MNLDITFCMNKNCELWSTCKRSLTEDVKEFIGDRSVSMAMFENGCPEIKAIEEKVRKEKARVKYREQHQQRLEQKYLNGEMDIAFCDCGNYFVSINNQKKTCESCKDNK